MIGDFRYRRGPTKGELLIVRCPVCEAEPKNPCRDEGGLVRKQLHAARVSAARQELAKESRRVPSVGERLAASRLYRP